ncbi:RNAse E [Rhodopseudomonas thermotolerans]|uniref:Ribonuclease E n=2 Tax=Rhodopseudomonas TaxID=1073 RepID=A0A336JYP4_9BRAD|nr:MULTISPECIES: ribonuclease E/G [Rhodopseudomonas]RED23023.1 RNAse E [Rhodopseudomonas pentothenatexigens]REF90159.1 RNAse E [Rhodopseudomonas thermotolerans]SSW93409.1 RNAse E [Rhodopseudomonas pentothenatexigens]
MANKMLIDATHPEETRVVVVRGNRVEEFDFETAQRKQLRGNIYLAKVTRVEPSLQAAFIEYGGNRHGFLAFSEIHPDYYQIPVADRQALIEADERAHREAEEESEQRSNRRRSRHRSHRRRNNGERVQSEIVEAATEAADQPHAAVEHHDVHEVDAEAAGDERLMHELHETDTTERAEATEAAPQFAAEHDEPATGAPAEAVEPPPAAEVAVAEPAEAEAAIPAAAEAQASTEFAVPAANDDAADHAVPATGYAEDAPFPIEETDEADDGHEVGEISEASEHDTESESEAEVEEDDEEEDDEEDAEEDVVESVGGDDVLEEVPERAFRPRRQYKIQEVIKRRQVMLVQVVKEERGNKGAALTTYLSLAGRYAVLMPNTARGGGISRKITSAQDRSRLKEVVQDLDVPEGMGVILRTAGASRTKPEIKRDFEYLIRMWETVRDITLNSQAPKLVYEEGSLIKRSLRDLYNKEIDEVLVAGEAGYREARDFMHMLMPSQVRAVKLYRDGQPLFSRMGVESQLDAMFSPTVQLRSGGYIVINQTEALVSIDVNSGRSTREHHIEDTALKTNIEAAEEVARQLRLRDLAGLIVIDFIDMDEKRNNRAVERKLSDCLRQDRARIQVGRISHFGLLEMSRQRIRASVLESSTEPCPHCGGSGHVRSVSSVALQLLRGLEEVLMKGATHNLIVRTRTDVALYVLNHKRGHLRDLETGFKVSLSVLADPTVSGQQSFVIDRGEQVHTLETAKALLAAQVAASPAPIEEPDDEDGYDFEAEIETEETVGLTEDQGGEAGETEGEGRKRRRRRRRRRSGEPREAAEAGTSAEDGEQPFAAEGVEQLGETDEGDDAGEDDNEGEARADQGENGERRPRRRGRRGGRRRRGNADGTENEAEAGVVGSISDELAAADEAEAADAVADIDSGSQSVQPSFEPAAEAEQSQPVAEPEPQPAPPAASETAEPAIEDESAAKKAARRRSTVREKVSFGAPASPPETTAAPAAEVETQPEAAVHEEQTAPSVPVSEPPAAEAETAAEAAPATAAAQEPAPAAPRRVGWWSRRFGGGN